MALQVDDGAPRGWEHWPAYQQAAWTNLSIKARDGGRHVLVTDDATVSGDASRLLPKTVPRPADWQTQMPQTKPPPPPPPPKHGTEVHLMCPMDAEAGSNCQFALANGRIISVRVPEGVLPGGRFTAVV